MTGTEKTGTDLTGTQKTGNDVTGTETSRHLNDGDELTATKRRRPKDGVPFVNADFFVNSPKNREVAEKYI